MSAPDELPPIPLTYGRAIRLKRVKAAQAKFRDTLIGFVAEDTIRQFEQHLKEVAER